MARQKKSEIEKAEPFLVCVCVWAMMLKMLLYISALASMWAPMAWPFFFSFYYCARAHAPSLAFISCETNFFFVVDIITIFTFTLACHHGNCRHNFRQSILMAIPHFFSHFSFSRLYFFFFSFFYTIFYEIHLYFDFLRWTFFPFHLISGRLSDFSRNHNDQNMLYIRYGSSDLGRHCVGSGTTYSRPQSIFVAGRFGIEGGRDAYI